jgi:hypothetical protein
VGRKNTSSTKGNGSSPAETARTGGTAAKGGRKNGGWQAVEALREKAALKASLADVWDEDFDLDEEILAELDHTAEFFTSQKEADEDIPDESEDIDEFFDDDEV